MQYSTSSENYSTTFNDKPSKWRGGSKEGKGGYAYKKASYQYSANGNNSYNYSDKSMDQNIDQLDALLEDLKNERQVTKDTKDLIASPTSYRTFERETHEPASTLTKTTKVIKTSKQLGGIGGGSNQYLDDSTDKYATSDYSTLRSQSGFSTLRDYPKTDEYRTKEITTYENNKTVPVPSTYETKTEVYKSSNRIFDDSVDLVVPKTSATRTSTTHLERDLQEMALSDDILPVPGTKVTTTVRTYTYEIPPGAPTTHHTSSTLNRNLNYSTLQRANLESSIKSSSSTTQNVVPIPTTSERSPNVPQTVVYNTESYSTYNKNNERPTVTNRSYEVREHHESNTIHKDLLPIQPQPHHQQQPRHHPIGPGPVGGTNRSYELREHHETNTVLSEPQQPPRHHHHPQPQTGPGGSKTIVYNINRTENIHHLPPNEPYTTHHSPSNSPNVPNGNYPPPTQQPGPTTSRYFYKESSNTVNTIHGPPDLPPLKRSPSGNYPPHHHTYPDGSPYPPTRHGQPAETNTYNYKYTSTSTNTRRGPGPDYGASPTPAPFPVDGVEYPIGNGNGPPQRVEELMQSFNGDVVDRTTDIETPHRKREVETAVASPNQPQIPTVNKAGREVYYPPGHDTMIMKREEMHAGSAAGGRWAKGSGNYEYESGYKSKSKTKSGGAMVPVCLPLCCAMPCSIM